MGRFTSVSNTDRDVDMLGCIECAVSIKVGSVSIEVGEDED
jgi:hypothetical protein